MTAQASVSLVCVLGGIRVLRPYTSPLSRSLATLWAFCDSRSPGHPWEGFVLCHLSALKLHTVSWKSPGNRLLPTVRVTEAERASQRAERVPKGTQASVPYCDQGILRVEPTLKVTQAFPVFRTGAWNWHTGSHGQSLAKEDSKCAHIGMHTLNCWQS